MVTIYGVAETEVEIMCNACKKELDIAECEDDFGDTIVYILPCNCLTEAKAKEYILESESTAHEIYELINLHDEKIWINAIYVGQKQYASLTYVYDKLPFNIPVYKVEEEDHLSVGRVIKKKF